jgi:hypothetical protein
MGPVAFDLARRKSLVRWPVEGEHHKARGQGRTLRLRRTQRPRQHRVDETEVGPEKFVTLAEITPRDGADFGQQIDSCPGHIGLDAKSDGVVDFDVFASICNPGKMALLISWKDARVADTWTSRKIDSIDKLQHRRIRVVRHYGRFDRRKAPQYYPDVKDGETRHPRPVREPPNGPRSSRRGLAGIRC